MWSEVLGPDGRHPGAVQNSRNHPKFESKAGLFAAWPNDRKIAPSIAQIRSTSAPTTNNEAIVDATLIFFSVSLPTPILSQ